MKGKTMKELIIDDKALKHIKNMMNLGNKVLPSKIDIESRKCFVCGKSHIMVGGSLIINKLQNFDDKKNKKQYIITRYAPLGCWLSHNKKQVEMFFNLGRDEEWLEGD